MSGGPHRSLPRRVLAGTVLALVFVAVMSAAILIYWLSDGFRDYIAWCDRFHEPLAAWAAQHGGDYPQTLAALPLAPYQPRYEMADCGYRPDDHGYQMVVLHGFGVSFYQSTSGEWLHD